MNHRLCLSFLAAAVLVAPLSAQDSSAKLPEKFDARLVDQYLNARAKDPKRGALSVAIVREGKLVLAKAYGNAAINERRAADTNTLFAIGSVSKQFTCAAILLLAEDGKLSVHDPVAKYYPGLTRAADITLLDLMNHTSGYPDYYPLDFVDRRMKKAVSADTLLSEYAGGKLDFEPGSRWSYSNTGYILLGRVVEKVSGQSLGAFLSHRIFQPLEMAHSAYEVGPEDSRLAKGYTTFLLSDPEVVPAEAQGWLGGAGGIYATPSDLAKWDMALIGGKVLKPESFSIMTTPRQLTNGKSAEYGCGLSVKKQNGRQVLAHNGAVSGFNTFNAVVPSTRSAVIMTCNLEGGMGSLPNQLLALLLKEESNVPVIDAAPAVETVKSVLEQLQRGKVNRQLFGQEFNEYLTDARVRDAATRLRAYGKPKNATIINTHERGGMEVTTTRLSFGKGDLQVLMYRMPNGEIEQFFVNKE